MAAGGGDLDRGPARHLPRDVDEVGHGQGLLGQGLLEGVARRLVVDRLALQQRHELS